MVLFRFRALALAALLCSAPGAAQSEPATILDEALATTRAMAFRTNQIDWPDLEAQVRYEAVDAKDIVDLLGAFEVLVEKLGDGHSFVNASVADRAEFRTRHGHEFDALRPHKSVTSSFRSRREPEARTVALHGNKTAQLVTVPMKQGGGAAATQYANALFAHVAAGADKSCGYIVDLRGNQGGNIWPMVAGLMPLLGDGWKSYELGRDGTTTSAGYLAAGAAVAGEGEYRGQTIVKVDGWRPLPRLARVPVAVLIDDAVASSGEGVAVAFKGRARTRYFGETTYGAASSNEGFVLDDRVNLVITTAMMADRNGRTYPNGIAPDERIASGPGSSTDLDDTVVEAAKRWLAAMQVCQRN